MGYAPRDKGRQEPPAPVALPEKKPTSLVYDNGFVTVEVYQYPFNKVLHVFCIDLRIVYAIVKNDKSFVTMESKYNKFHIGEIADEEFHILNKAWAEARAKVTIQE